jgi:hypothetical protein
VPAAVGLNPHPDGDDRVTGNRYGFHHRGGALMIALLAGALIIESPPANQHGPRFDPCALEMDWGMLEFDGADMQRLTSHARRIRWGKPNFQTPPCH